MSSLRWRLSGALLLALALCAALFGWASSRAGLSHHDEVSQRLHHGLAANLVAESPLLKGGAVAPDALEHVFHTLMVVNPSIEVYLLDRDGRVLRYSAPEGRVVLDRVDLRPIRDFLRQARPLPIRGDDPRHPGERKVFTAAPIEGDAELEGYLYVVLQSEQHEAAEAGVLRGVLGRITLAGVASLALFALAAGVITQRLLVRRLRALDRQVHALQESDFERVPADLLRLADPTGDEIARLAASIDAMALRIAEQVRALRETDEHRRRLVAGVSHDLRTPLAALEGYLETLLLKGGEVGPAQQRHYVEIAMASANRLSRLVEELFELAKLEAAETLLHEEELSLTDLAHDVMQKFALRAKQADVALAVVFDRGATFALAELGMIERVLENLVDNALRHTPPGGSITLRGAAAGGRIRITLTDTGCGIAESDLPHVFERFQHHRDPARGRTGGAGLGLAIAHRIVELHGGTLTVRSREGEGTTFEFTLPAPPTAGGRAEEGLAAPA